MADKRPEIGTSVDVKSHGNKERLTVEVISHSPGFSDIFFGMVTHIDGESKPTDRHPTEMPYQVEQILD